MFKSMCPFAQHLVPQNKYVHVDGLLPEGHEVTCAYALMVSLLFPQFQISPETYESLFNKIELNRIELLGKHTFKAQYFPQIAS